MPPKKTKAVSGAHWEWKNDAGVWIAYHEKDSAMLEEQYNSGKRLLKTTDFTFNTEFKTPYTIDFRSNTQKNMESKVVRDIRRVAPLDAAAGGAPDAKKAKPGEEPSGKPKWEWFADTLTWEPYDPKDADLLEMNYTFCKSKLCYTKDLTFNVGYDSLYIFDFRVMTQINTESGTSRKMRRVVAGEKADEGAAAGEGAEDDTAAFVDAAAAPETETTTSSSSSSDEAGVIEIDTSEPFTIMTAKKAYVVSPTTEAASPAAAAPVTPAAAAAVGSAMPKNEVRAQSALGAQSKRSVTKIDYGPVVSKDKHGCHCFDKMLENEARLCGEWAVFYHSYSAAALMYEVQAAVACVLFRFKSTFGTLPRLLTAPYEEIPDAPTLLKMFPKMKERDHNLKYRAAAICGTSALLAEDSEAPAKSVFLMGYSVGPLTGVLERLLTSCGVPKKDVATLTKKIVALAVEHGLDARGHGGKPCKSGRSGHLLQIFLRRELVNKYIYGSFPFGVPDPARPDLAEYLAGAGPIAGQVRIVFDPSVFMRANCARLFVYSADPTYHENREAFQEKLTALLQPVLGKADARVRAAKGIFNGKLPSWWDSTDQSSVAKVANPYK